MNQKQSALLFVSLLLTIGAYAPVVTAADVDHTDFNGYVFNGPVATTPNRLVLPNGEYIDNNTNGTLNIGAANLTSTGTVTGDALVATTSVTLPSGSVQAADIGNGLTDTQVNNDLTIAGGTVDNSEIGSATPAGGAFTTLTASGAFSLTGDEVQDAEVVDALTLTASTIENSIIGAATPAAGTFTTVTASGGAIDGAVIGGATPAAITGTTITATTLVAGARTLSVTQYSADPNAASVLASFPGVDADDFILATMNTPASTTALLAAEASVDGVTLTWSADPNQAVTVTIQAWTD